ncbi:hypothetical protein VIBC2010_06514 [Vibrio caribbeanicus ATCC BAA-2122]|uniref:Uncharacterized protein n=1 Tax=Vibrio caribbeanicus ATCC BAA-2122 TaxID=796620 RepID=E3BFZ9_9VIBR|nr:hypothetical protein VIBC2010_06514 [Vibrio caribbeanicus ATCC BAA-2122]
MLDSTKVVSYANFARFVLISGLAFTLISLNFHIKIMYKKLIIIFVYV